MEYGLGFNFDSSFFLRYNYISITLLGLFVLMKNRSIPQLGVVFTLIVFFIIGASIGLLKANVFHRNQHGTYVYFSHMFYLIHPILSITLGWNVFTVIFGNKSFYGLFRKFMLHTFFFGLGIALFFYFLFESGNSNYDSIDIWNIFFGGSFFLSITNSLFAPVIVILAALLLGKRVGIVSSILLSLFHYYKTMRGKSVFFTLLFVFSFIALIQSIDFESFRIAGVDRIIATTSDTAESNSLDKMTAGRFVEASTALQILSESIFSLLFGMGFGAYFVPWPDLDSTYLSHYTHFTPISYFWIGGMFLPLLIYFFLIKLLISISRLKSINVPLGTKMFFQMFLTIVIVSSFSGAVLMNNSILWMFIGMAYRLVSLYGFVGRI